MKRARILKALGSNWGRGRSLDDGLARPTLAPGLSFGDGLPPSIIEGPVPRIVERLLLSIVEGVGTVVHGAFPSSSVVFSQLRSAILVPSCTAIQRLFQ